ncbi:permease [Kingella negevensis]|uniref:CBU_0592 family membrane protein n=1 Tax=Kingella negevensis TaxID=1522312 RepID=UPI002542CA82|nr:permease [Kingella negevensis]MDK4680663.1 permease [Kingella negevensis]MDK4681614.1 permease [Kingella negevensis]MDK4683698.1 permease [Kingella negevensis]MDK4689812.1 permease [Kingella negevensis]MDK4692844.1 permease [Kingella negevensis]
MNGILQYVSVSPEVAEMIGLAAHIVGFIGMGCVVFAFWCVVSERWKPTSLPYNLVNGFGAVLLILSLLVHFNLGSFVIEIFWIGISGMGILNHFKHK